MKFKKLTLLIILNVMLFVSCTNNDDTPQDNETDKLRGTIWLNNTGNCHAYYKFDINGFEVLNPCLENNEYGFVYYESGSYNIEDNKLILSISESCNENNVGTESSFEFTLTETELTFIENNQTFILQKINQWPILPDQIEYGYFDFDNNGIWMVNMNCKP